MKISVVIATYRRGNNLDHLKKTLKSVFDQTHQDFKIYLIGDRFEGEDEIKDLILNFDKDKIYFENLQVAMERDFYDNKQILWLYGGCNARNRGIEISLSEGNDYICHLDHDDIWDSDHLEMVNKCIEETGSDWMCSKSKYKREEILIDMILPIIDSDDEFIDFLPVPHGIVHSSVCINFKKVPLRYRDIYRETGSPGDPSDADLWKRCSDFIVSNNLKSTLINKLTCASC